MNNLHAAFAISCFLAAAPLLARADSTNLNPVADTALLEKNPDFNLGGTNPILAGTTATGPRSRALFRFDLSQLPAGTTINSASFTIQVTKKNFSGVGSDFTLHRLLRSWGEGAGSFLAGAPAADGEATWNNRFHPSDGWGAPGAAADVDFVSSGSATKHLDDPGSYTFSSTPALVADIQKWVDNPSTNFGWILITESEGTVLTSRRIASRSDPTAPPTLSIQYTVSTQAPPAIPPIISKVALTGNQIRFSFNAESNRTYTVEFRSAVGTGNWGTLTNIPAQPAPATIDVADTISGVDHFYRIRTP
jgi:hypothetical protein